MIKAVDRTLFESVYINQKYIVINCTKILIDQSGLFNQILYHFERKKKKEAFIEWLCEKYKVKSLLDSHKMDYEYSLQHARKNTIYYECLRIMYRNDTGDIDFYGIIEGNQLAYLSSVNSIRFYPTIAKFLKFNKRCKEIAKKLGYTLSLISPAKMKSEIDECLEDDALIEIKEIHVLSNNPDELCLAYYDLNNLPSKSNTPAWDSFVNTLTSESSKECFMASLYSLFVGRNRSRQILYLYGAGNSGKSVVARTIMKRLQSINSSICTTLEEEAYQDKFSAASYENKRLVISSDSNDCAILRSKLVKNITGNDPIAARRMGQDKEYLMLFSRVVVTSNRLPWCNLDKPEEISRMLLFKLDPAKAFNASRSWDFSLYGDWAVCLYDEIDAFIGKCKPYYDKLLMEDGHNIKPYEDMEEIILNNDLSLIKDMRIWWDACIKPYDGIGKKTNVLTFTDLFDDFNRYLYPTNTTHRYDYVIKRLLPVLMNEKNIPIYTLDIKNEKCIDGYQFQHGDRKKRMTFRRLQQQQIDLINSGEETFKDVE